MSRITKKKRKVKYSYIGLRPTETMEARLRAVAESTGRGLSDLVRICIDKQLPALERDNKKAA